MESTLYYLALPYQGTEAQKKERTDLSLKFTVSFLKQGINLFAPVIYVNQIADNLDFDSLEQRRQVIMPYLLEFLRVSKALIIITIEGWDKSWGIKEEVKFCNTNNIPIIKISPEELSGDLKALLLNKSV